MGAGAAGINAKLAYEMIPGGWQLGPRLADMAIEIDAARLLIWEAASRLDRGDDALKESYLAKNYLAASALKGTITDPRECLQ